MSLDHILMMNDFNKRVCGEFAGKTRSSSWSIYAHGICGCCLTLMGELSKKPHAFTRPPWPGPLGRKVPFFRLKFKARDAQVPETMVLCDTA